MRFPAESSDDSHEEMPTVLEPEVVIPDNNCNKNQNGSAKKLVQIDETNGNTVVSVQQQNGNTSSSHQNNG